MLCLAWLIEKAGYFQRQSCTDDGRGQILLITKSSIIIRKKIWSVYGKALQQAIGNNLCHEDKEQLLQLLVQLKQTDQKIINS